MNDPGYPSKQRSRWSPRPQEHADAFLWIPAVILLVVWGRFRIALFRGFPVVQHDWQYIFPLKPIVCTKILAFDIR
jgi:hypothetical protein